MFPIVCYMVWDLIITLVSTVALESVFSAGKRVLDIRRCSLLEKSMEALVCLKDWMNATSRMQNMPLEDNSDEDANETERSYD